jgi:phenylalanyl-tRNA synthetase alpha chain
VIEKIHTLLEDARQQLKQVDSEEKLEELRVRYLGRKGIMSEIFSSIPGLPDGEKPKAGKTANKAKQELQRLLEGAKERLQSSRKTAKPSFDPTMPPLRPPLGHIHPLSQTIEEVSDIFRTMGFTMAEGPEIERDWYNFEALNIPADHPSRDDFDTFYINDDTLLRSQTSTVQIRTMERTEPPIRIIAPGRCFRPDTEDARHTAMFHQIEGLLIDEGISFSDLKAVLHIFASEFFHKDMDVRFRPSYFPFTEPSAEVDCTCPVCNKQGCKTCSYSGWLELLGAGMVDPNVFKAVDYNPEKYTGFAFGMGVERLAMLKYGIDDIRLFYESDLRFLRQF